MSVIEVNSLTKDYGSGRGVFDVTFQVEKGEVFGFLGPNGAGKSTTIRHLMGFSKPQSGQTKIFGKDIRKVILNKSYRNTWEIAQYAAGISGITGLELLERHGKPVSEE